MTTNGDGTRERLIAELEARLVTISQMSHALAREAHHLMPILSGLRTGTLAVGVAMAMLMETGIVEAE